MSYSETLDAGAIAGEADGARADGWTAARRLDFLEALGRHGNVAAAADHVGLSASAAYRLRARDAGGAFARAWQAAAAMVYYRLRDVALKRVERGAKTTRRRGDDVIETTQFSDRLLLGLLDHLKPAANADPVADYAAAVDAFATAVETGAEPVMPAPVATPASPSWPAGSTPRSDQPVFADDLARDWFRQEGRAITADERAWMEADTDAEAEAIWFAQEARDAALAAARDAALAAARDAVLAAARDAADGALPDAANGARA